MKYELRKENHKLYSCFTRDNSYIGQFFCTAYLHGLKVHGTLKKSNWRDIVTYDMLSDKLKDVITDIKKLYRISGTAFLLF